MLLSNICSGETEVMRRTKGPVVTRNISCERLVLPCCIWLDCKRQCTPGMLVAVEKSIPLGHATDLSPLGGEPP